MIVQRQFWSYLVFSFCAGFLGTSAANAETAQQKMKRVTTKLSDDVRKVEAARKAAAAKAEADRRSIAEEQKRNERLRKEEIHSRAEAALAAREMLKNVPKAVVKKSVPKTVDAAAATVDTGNQLGNTLKNTLQRRSSDAQIAAWKREQELALQRQQRANAELAKLREQQRLLAQQTLSKQPRQPQPARRK